MIVVHSRFLVFTLVISRIASVLGRYVFGTKLESTMVAMSKLSPSGISAFGGKLVGQPNGRTSRGERAKLQTTRINSGFTGGSMVEPMLDPDNYNPYGGRKVPEKVDNRSDSDSSKRWMKIDNQWRLLTNNTTSNIMDGTSSDTFDPKGGLDGAAWLGNSVTTGGDVIFDPVGGPDGAAPGESNPDDSKELHCLQYKPTSFSNATGQLGNAEVYAANSGQTLEGKEVNTPGRDDLPLAPYKESELEGSGVQSITNQNTNQIGSGPSSSGTVPRTTLVPKHARRTIFK